MRGEYFITMDTHCRTTDVCVKTARGKLLRREHLSTGIPQLRELIEWVPRPRRVYKQVCRIARKDKVMSRVSELPGYGPVRAATLITYLDTPWRFKSKAAPWKYVGIGLRREKSGNGSQFICVEQACNRLPRGVGIGTARTAIDQKENVFGERYARWIREGLSSRNARRNVARDQVTAVWGMWKSDQAFDARLICPPS